MVTINEIEVEVEKLRRQVVDFMRNLDSLGEKDQPLKLPLAKYNELGESLDEMKSQIGYIEKKLVLK